VNFKSSFCIKSDTRHLKPLREWVGAVAGLLKGSGFPDLALMPCSLALTEAVDNAIFHAHDGNPELPIVISLKVSDSGIVMEVVDRGKGIEDIDTPEPDEMLNHGRGLFIIRQLMSEIESFVSGGEHHLRMTYRI
jgi:anti-sigma regulatory factor (Ser/Thr protein kinase)